MIPVCAVHHMLLRLIDDAGISLVSGTTLVSRFGYLLQPMLVHSPMRVVAEDLDCYPAAVIWPSSLRSGAHSHRPAMEKRP